MKKRLMVFAAILIGSTAIYGQSDLKKMQKLPVDSLNGRISFREEIRDVPPASKMELFSRALEWFKHDFPPNPDNHPTEGVDSIRFKRIKVGDYNGVYGIIASTAENRIASLRSAMWE